MAIKPETERSRADDIDELMTEATIGQETFNRLFGLGKAPGYRAARKGPFPAVKIGKLYRYPTPPIRKALHLDPQTAA